jgi:hypothetical protein
MKKPSSESTQRRSRALLAGSAVIIFALGLLLPVVAFSRPGGLGPGGLTITICLPLGHVPSHVLPPCTDPTSTTEPTTTQPTTTEPTTTAPTTTAPTTTAPTTPTTPTVPVLVPVLGRSAVAAPLRGVIRFRAPGSRRYVTLSGQKLIPIGSDVDASHGRIGITSATAHGKQTGAFYSGMFRLQQPLASAARTGSGKVLTVLRLIGGSFKGCEADEDNGRSALSPATAFAASRPRHRVVRRLWGSEGGGGWSTAGNQAAGTVRGTVWLTEDTCLGTYIYVKRGVVSVHNLVNGHTVTVRARHHYLALAPDPT